MNEQEKNAIREAKNEYMKRWRAKNKDLAKANSDRYWLKKAEKLKKRS